MTNANTAERFFNACYFGKGHGIQQRRTNIAEMVRCQIKHEETRCSNGEK